MKINNIQVAILCLLGMIAFSCKPAAKQSIPHLEKRGNVTQLVVDGKPFLVLGGELHNSSASNLAYMKPVWPRLAAMHLNTVLAVVSWDQLEPAEGKFDFTLVDGLLADARQHNLRLVVLWFGSWKNGISSYMPGWVKTNQKRFPLVKTRDGKSLDILSTLGEETCKADARAFAALMEHIRNADAATNTILMVQVENEVGMHSDTRDHSTAANEAFASQVPKQLMDYLAKHRSTLLPETLKAWEISGFKTSGTWEEVFGQTPAADELFMAWNYARFVNRVAEAGKAQYPLPMFVNCWLVQPQDKVPGDYPSGGPVDRVHDIWRAGAPAIDILAPDIYLPNFTEIVTRYSRSGNPVFIPESKAGVVGAASAFYAIGQHGSIGYSPFGVESRGDEKEAIPKAYSLLSQLAPVILEHQASGTIAGAFLTRDNPAQTVKLGNYILNVRLRNDIWHPEDKPELGYGILIALAANEYLIAGNDMDVTFTPAVSDSVAGITTVEEGTFVCGKWVPGRRLNGDEIQLRYDLSAAASENQSGAGLRFPANQYSIQRVKLFNYK
jgi:hypothetical protein